MRDEFIPAEQMTNEELAMIPAPFGSDQIALDNAYRLSKDMARSQASGNQLLYEDQTSAWWVKDTLTGSSQIYPVSNSGMFKLNIGTTAETGTINDPLSAGIWLLFTATTVGSGGSRALTYATGFDSVGTTVITFNLVRQTVYMQSVPDKTSSGSATGFRWQVYNYDSTVPYTSRVTTQYNIASSTAVVLVPGLSFSVIAGKSYAFYGRILMTVGATGGAQIFAAGTATATAINMSVDFINYVTPAVTGARITAMQSGTTAAGQTAYDADVTGLITVNAAGTFGVGFAQAVSNGVNSSVLVGSWFQITPVL